MKIIFEDEIRRAAPALKVYTVEADIINPPTSDRLWEEIMDACREIRTRYELADIRHRPAIDAIRNAYKELGKEPNRYRPSSESLMRRVVKGLDLYRSLTCIDLINLVSLVSGHSIGGFDADKIDGSSLTLGAGREGEPYEGIGRGELNIAAMPVFRDATGGIGTPTSDNERTKLSPETRRIFMTINIYREGEIPSEKVISMMQRLLSTYAGSTEIKVTEWRI
ncbi:MAG: hypothetical protein K2I58_02145 [Candidatus Amulumruptor sp.]|nr:hypothetical protein [Candidatus Amulumruptor sp.]MDE7237188.1 hypothetical protein [Paramuribaculum sp.]